VGLLCVDQRSRTFLGRQCAYAGRRCFGTRRPRRGANRQQTQAFRLASTRNAAADGPPPPPGPATLKKKDEVPDFIRDYVTWGAGPRATQYLVLGAKARAVLHGRYYVSCEDIRAVAGPVLRHRIITNFNAEAEGIKPDDIIRRLADVIPRDPNEELVPSTARANLEE